MTHPHACADCWVCAQHRVLLAKLRTGRVLTAKDAHALAVTNMPTRMAELRGLGFPITTEFVHGRNSDGSPGICEEYSIRTGAERSAA